MITKKSVHESFEQLMDKSIEEWYREPLKKDIESFYDTQIQKLLEEITPKEAEYPKGKYNDVLWGELDGYNQAISAIKQKIKEAGF